LICTIGPGSRRGDGWISAKFFQVRLHHHSPFRNSSVIAGFGFNEKYQYPAPWGGKGGNASAFQGLPWGIDTFHFEGFPKEFLKPVLFRTLPWNHFHTWNLLHIFPFTSSWNLPMME
jgi:hypothetical protein